jgi:hypothetical protein
VCTAMVIHCLSFGSLWWLRPGDDVSDPLRFSSRAAIFNTTGFISNSRERRLWHIAGVIRINAVMHCGTSHFDDARYECPGLERRGEWNRLLLGRRLNRSIKAEKIMACVHSTVVGRIRFDSPWSDDEIQVISGSALRGQQETLLLASPGAQFQTDRGRWEVSWDGMKRQ